MDAEDTAETVGAMREWRALKILEELALDDATDIVSELDEKDRKRLLSKLTPETSSLRSQPPKIPRRNGWRGHES